MKKTWIAITLFFIALLALWTLVIQVGRKYIEIPDSDKTEISIPVCPDTVHAGYWNYNGKTILLLGLSDQNLFSTENYLQDLTEHSNSGANYIRINLSPDKSNQYTPYLKEEGLYDLDKWNPEFWARFDTMLNESEERGVIVQLELWNSEAFEAEGWDKNPYNPKNNANLYGFSDPNEFFNNTPDQNINIRLLAYQQKWIDKILSYTLDRPNVIYSVDNGMEISSTWYLFWMQYMHRYASEQDKHIFISKPWKIKDLHHVLYDISVENPEFGYFDISSNNSNNLNTLQENILSFRTKTLKPANSLFQKDMILNDSSGSTEISGFVINVLSGVASVSFSTPSTKKTNVIRSIRMMQEETDFFNMSPCKKSSFDNHGKQVFCQTIPCKEYIVYFQDKTSANIPSGICYGSYTLKWLDVLNADWHNEQKIELNKSSILIPPSEGMWIAIIKKE